MQGEVYKPRQAIPNVMVPIDIEGFNRVHVNIYIVKRVKLTPGHRYTKHQRRLHLLSNLYVKKHPFKSKFWNPYKADSFGYWDGFIKPEVTIESDGGNLLASYTCTCNDHARSVYKQIRNQLGMV